MFVSPNKKGRMDLAKRLLGALNAEPQSLEKLSTEFGCKYSTLWYMTTKLRDANLLKIARGGFGGLVIQPDAEVTEDSICTALGYRVAKQVDFQAVTCTMCGETKFKKFSYGDGYKRFYIDKQGRNWSANRCPDCIEQAKQENKPTHRKCRDCGDFLPATRYFKCMVCQPTLSGIDDEYVYHSASGVLDIDLPDDEPLDDDDLALLEDEVPDEND